MAKWMQKAFGNPKTKGALHAALGVPGSQTIPVKRLVQASHSDNPKMRHRAQAALNARKANAK